MRNIFKAVTLLILMSGSAVWAQNTVTITNDSPLAQPMSDADLDSLLERLRDATPMPLYIPDDADRPTARNGGAIRGAPGAAAGGLPSPEAIDEARARFPEQWARLSQPTNAGQQNGFDAPSLDRPMGTNGVYTAYCEDCDRERNEYPRSAIGRLFFQPNGSSGTSTCTASVISGNNVIVTAAHCCYQRGSGWASNFTFIPAYRNGAAPYGSFNWSAATILTGWIDAGRRWQDVCVISLNNDAAGRGVSYYTGWLGRQWNRPYVQNLHAFGHPSNLTSGEYLQVCAAESRRPRNGVGCDRYRVMNMGCNMTYGASGGPWIAQWRTDNYVGSVVSGWDNSTCTGDFGTTFNGALFVDRNIVTLCNRRGC